MESKLTLLLPFFALCANGFAQEPAKVREHILIDTGWRFALGHATDTRKDFDFGTQYFSYLAKTGFGEGVYTTSFDDRSWRKLDLPHDWAVEQPFDREASFSHGFRAIGHNFPAASIGWYRKKFTVPATDLGRHISLAFDGVFRNSIVWVNGHYLGTEPSGYTGFEYNISEYLNYGGENTIVVRADATMEEGWFYEGAGIYRHVWLNKTSLVHVAVNGTFVTAAVHNSNADVTAQVTLTNENTTATVVDVQQVIMNADGKTVASGSVKNVVVRPYEDKEVAAMMDFTNPTLWSLDTPYLYKLVTIVTGKEKTLDTYETRFGIRTIRFDANEGFFLNGKHLKIHGTNNHQDHAGVGAALPDGLIKYRIKALQSIGCNAYRCSHNPPTPELLDACDRLGMLVIDENRLMGTTTTELGYMKRMMLRDRNHPSIISWSIGNEEWGIEGNIFGARIATAMQAFAKSVDTTRAITAAISGGWRQGISNVIDVMGANYIAQINTDEQHKKFPNQPIWGTEEGSTFATRGIYVDEKSRNLIAAYDKKPRPDSYSLEEGWKHYSSRDYLSGMFIWTGFDYRGEPTPFGFPSIGSYFGMLDQCGFPKDDAYYLKSWWTNKTTLHLLPHWNWKGKEGQQIDVWAYSNCDEVELFLNKKSQGKKVMEKNGHLEWKVKYEPGTLTATGYKNGKKAITDMVKTTGEAEALNLAADQPVIEANRQSVSMIAVNVIDKNKLTVPEAGNEITFSLSGPGKIIGVGNGDPTSLEADKYIESVRTISFANMKEKHVDNLQSTTEITTGYNDANWQPAFSDDDKTREAAKAIVYRTHFNINAADSGAVTVFYNSMGRQQSLYLNGQALAVDLPESRSGNEFKIDSGMLHSGDNVLAIVATPFIKQHSWDNINKNPGTIQIIQAAKPWKRKLFNGLAQVIVQSTGEPGIIHLVAASPGLKQSEITVEVK